MLASIDNLRGMGEKIMKGVSRRGFRRKRKKTPGLALLAVMLAGVTGAALAYFLDPNAGRRRRHTARDKLFAISRRGVVHAQRFGRFTSSTIYGYSQKLIHLMPTARPTPSDETLAQRVRSKILRDPALPKHRITISAEQGIIILRGEVDQPEQIRTLEKKARKIPGVRGVENLLHLSGVFTPTQY
jgi:hypothetical protein